MTPRIVPSLYDNYLRCPKCRAPAGEPCRSLIRVYHAHNASVHEGRPTVEDEEFELDPLDPEYFADPDDYYDRHGDR